MVEITRDEEWWSIDVALAGLGERCSDETRRLVLVDRERFSKFWLLEQEGLNPSGYQNNPDDFEECGWAPDAPATLTAAERGLSPEAATSVLKDFGATPREACNMNGFEFEARFGKSWFDILPRVNG